MAKIIIRIDKYGGCSARCNLSDSEGRPLLSCGWCIRGWDNEDFRPGPDCPGPGVYELVKKEGAQ